MTTPRLHKIKLICPTTQAGNLFTCLLGAAASTPQLVPTETEGETKIEFTATLDALETIIGVVKHAALSLAVAPVSEQPAEAVRPFLARAAPVSENHPDKIRRLPMRAAGRAKGSGAGAKAVLATLEETPLARAGDFEPAFRAAQLQLSSIAGTLSKLVAYGLIVRQQNGLYRLPTEDERRSVTQ